MGLLVHSHKSENNESIRVAGERGGKRKGCISKMVIKNASMSSTSGGKNSGRTIFKIRGSLDSKKTN